MSPQPRARVLIVDEDPNTSQFLSSQMLRKGLDVSAASTADEAVRIFRVCDPALVVLDPILSGAASLELVERLKQIKPEVASFSSVLRAVRSLSFVLPRPVLTTISASPSMPKS